MVFPFVAILQKEDVSLTLLGVQGITTYLQSHNIREAHTYWYEYPLLTAVIVSLQGGNFRTVTSKKLTLLYLICLVKLLFH